MELHFIPQKQFWHDMMGMSRSWYYKLQKADPNFPQPVDVKGKPKLVKEECLAYQASLVEARDKTKKGG